MPALFLIKIRGFQNNSHKLEKMFTILKKSYGFKNVQEFNNYSRIQKLFVNKKLQI